MNRNYFIKSAIAAIAVSATILAIIAGGFAMSLMMTSGSHANCLAAIPGQPDCAGTIGSIRFVLMHINALLDVSLGVIGSIAAVIASIILVIWLGIAGAARLLPLTRNYPIIAAERNIRSIHKQRRWISLLEKRDPRLCFAMNA